MSPRTKRSISPFVQSGNLEISSLTGFEPGTLFYSSFYLLWIRMNDVNQLCTFFVLLFDSIVVKLNPLEDRFMTKISYEISDETIVPNQRLSFHEKNLDRACVNTLNSFGS